MYNDKYFYVTKETHKGTDTVCFIGGYCQPSDKMSTVYSQLFGKQFKNQSDRFGGNHS